MDSRITITIRTSGSYFIAGDDIAKVRLVDADGNEVSTEGRKAISLCRCGQSKNMPFCDSSHKEAGFAAPCVAARVVPIPPGPAEPTPEG
jgi:CDGSH-type Zn-finger protein